MYIRRRRPEASRREESQGPTLVAAVSRAVDAANARMRAFGRSEWDAVDAALARRELCATLRKMPVPWPDVAERMAQAPPPEPPSK